MPKGFLSIILALTLGPAFAQETKAPQPILPDMPSAATPQTGEMAKPAFPLPDKKPVPPPVVVKAPAKVPVKVAPVKVMSAKATPAKQAPKKGSLKKPPSPKPSFKKNKPARRDR